MAPNVKWFGATGDGVTDDTTAIQATFDLRRGVFFPKGTYSITDTIDVGTNSAACNQSRFQCESQGTKIVGTAGMAGLPMFRIEGGAIQQYGNHFEGFRLDLNGAGIGIDFLRGSTTSSINKIRIEDSSSTSGSIGVRVYNSFNITLTDIQTVGINGNAVKYVARSAEAGFPNLTNNKISNGILQNQGASEIVNLVEYDLDNAADTATIENVALKADAVGSNCVYVDGFINQLKLDTLHIESSNTGITTTSGNTVYMSIKDCIFTNVGNCLDIQGAGDIWWSGNRCVNGSGNFVFTNLSSDLYINGPLLVASGSYDVTIQAGTGKVRRTERRWIETGTSRTLDAVEDNTIFFNGGGTLNLTLPATQDVGAGFKTAVLHRGGNVTLTPDASDRILGISGTTAGATVTTSSTGTYLEIESQNIGGTDDFWVVTTINGAAATP